MTSRMVKLKMTEKLYFEILCDIANLKEDDLFIIAGKIKELRKKYKIDNTPFNKFQRNSETIRRVSNTLISDSSKFYYKKPE